MNPQNAPMPLRPICWIAVRADSPAAVAEAVGIEDPRPCAWKEGQERCFGIGEGIFVTPPVRGGWIVVAAPRFAPSERSADDPFLEFLRELSERFGECFHFGEDNGMRWCTFVWCRAGEIVRAYHFQTDPECAVLWNAGAPPEAERALPDYRLRAGYEGPVPNDEAERWLLREGQTHELARAWCFDPAELSPADGETGIDGLTNGTSEFDEADDAGEGIFGAGDGDAAWCGMPNSMVFDADAGGMQDTAAMQSFMHGGFPQPPEPTAEELEAEEELERAVASIDTRHLLELYAEEKALELPPRPFGEECEDFGALAECFGAISGPLAAMLPREMQIAVGAVTASDTVKRYRERVRPRR